MRSCKHAFTLSLVCIHDAHTSQYIPTKMCQFAGIVVIQLSGELLLNEY